MPCIKSGKTTIYTVHSCRNVISCPKALLSTSYGGKAVSVYLTIKGTIVNCHSADLGFSNERWATWYTHPRRRNKFNNCVQVLKNEVPFFAVRILACMAVNWIGSVHDSASLISHFNRRGCITHDSFLKIPKVSYRPT
jgi:hypothetical protein